MTTTLPRPPRPAPVPDPRPPLPWLTAGVTGVAVLLASAPVSAVVRGTAWFGDAALTVAVLVAVGLALHRRGAVVVALGQCVALVLLLTALFTRTGFLLVLPGPAVWGDFGTLLGGARSQIAVGIAPVAGTAAILFLTTASIGLVAVAVHLATVGVGAPAAGGVPLLAMFAVPAALADDLLPWWALVGAAAGFGLLLLTREGARRQLPGGAALLAVAVVVALGLGAVSGIGTAGRFNGGGGGGAGGSIGLSPFTSLRGQLSRSTPTELFRVRGLPQPTYLRALTLREFVPDTGWQATRPGPGPTLPGTVAPTSPRDVTTVTVENVAFRDYWLPLYGRPVGVDGVPGGQWTFDARSGTAFSTRPREEGSWRERTSFAQPTAAQLRAARGSQNPGPEYSTVTGIDPRVTAIAREVTQGRTTAFDRVLALQDYFTGPRSQFRYSLATAPGAGDDALVEFLTVGRAGYCEQFASAMAVMLRSVGVPSRVAVGFTGGSQADGYQSVNTSDAHAWVEAWFPGIGWTTFDPTPLTDGRVVTPPYVAEAQAEAAADPAGGTPADERPTPEDPRAGTTPDGPEAPPEDAAPATPDPVTDAGPPAWPFVGLGALVLAALALLTPSVLRARERRTRLAAVAAGGPDAATAAWTEVLAESADRGVALPPSTTVRATARHLVQEYDLDPDAQHHLRQVVNAVEADWYGAEEPAAGELEPAVRGIRAGIAARQPLSRREQLLPRSATTELRRRLRSSVKR